MEKNLTVECLFVVELVGKRSDFLFQSYQQQSKSVWIFQASESAAVETKFSNSFLLQKMHETKGNRKVVCFFYCKSEVKLLSLDACTESRHFKGIVNFLLIIVQLFSKVLFFIFPFLLSLYKCDPTIYYVLILEPFCQVLFGKV